MNARPRLISWALSLRYRNAGARHAPTRSSHRTLRSSSSSEQRGAFRTSVPRSKLSRGLATTLIDLASRRVETAANRDSRLYIELLSGALGCTSAAVSWVVVVGSAGAVPITGGASSFITALSYTAAGASSLQCANSALRVYNELESPSVFQQRLHARLAAKRWKQPSKLR